MSAFLPSVFKFRQVLVVFLALLFFLFIGLVYRSFAYDAAKSCGYCESLWPDRFNEGYIVNVTGSYDTSYEADAACEAESGVGCIVSSAGAGTDCWGAYYVTVELLEDGTNQFTAHVYSACLDCGDDCPLDGTCDDEQCSVHAECECADQGGIASYDDSIECLFECVDPAPNDCPDSDDDGLPDCCGGNLDCPDSDGDGIYDCCGDGAPCEDSDGDGSPDSCDPCPDDPAITQKEICVYKVTSACGYIEGYTTGDVCGTKTTTCTTEADCSSSGSQYVPLDGECGWHCCEESGCYSAPCEVDPETCKPKKCVCPDGQEHCTECQDPDCTCPNGEESCEECQLPDPNDGCECPDGQSPCADCQDPDCTCSDGSDVCSECQYPTPPPGTCDCPDGQSPCAECQDPGCTCNDGTTDPCAECQLPTSPSGPGGTVPNVLPVGGCEIDLTEFKEWLLTDEAFPFNFFYAIFDALGPLFNSSSDTPYIGTSISLEGADRYSYIPDSIPIVLDFEKFTGIGYIVAVIRFVLNVTIVLALLSYGINRYHNFHGISR